MGLGQEFLQLRVLSLELAQALDLMNLHSPKLRTPAVERRIAETVLTAQLPHWHPGLGFLQKSDDLLLGKPPLLHVRFSSQKRTLLTYRWYRLRGAGQGIYASERCSGNYACALSHLRGMRQLERVRLSRRGPRNAAPQTGVQL